MIEKYAVIAILENRSNSNYKVNKICITSDKKEKSANYIENLIINDRNNFLDNQFSNNEYKLAYIDFICYEYDEEEEENYFEYSELIRRYNVK